ncbi:MAG: mechanosensitive ion channel domain-containing protein [Planctomycetota bacterium]
MRIPIWRFLVILAWGCLEPGVATSQVVFQSGMQNVPPPQLNPGETLIGYGPITSAGSPNATSKASSPVHRVASFGAQRYGSSNGYPNNLSSRDVNHYSSAPGKRYGTRAVIAGDDLTKFDYPYRRIISGVKPLSTSFTVSGDELTRVGRDLDFNTQLTPDEKAVLHSKLNQANQHLQSAMADANRGGEIEAQLSNAPRRHDELRNYIEQVKLRIRQRKDGSRPLPQNMASSANLREAVDRELLRASENLSETNTLFGSSVLAGNMDSLQHEISKVESELQSLAQLPLASMSSNDADAVDSLLAHAKRDAMHSKLERLRRQLQLRSDHAGLFNAEVDAAHLYVADLEWRLATVDQWLENSKSLAAISRAKKFRQLSENTHPLLREMYLENAELADALAELSTSRQDINHRIESVSHELREVREKHQNASAKLAQYGLTPTVGLLLRHSRDRLPAVSLHRQTLHVAQSRMRDAQQQQLTLDLMLEPLHDLDAEADRRISESRDVHYDEADGLRTPVMGILDTRRDLLNEIVSDMRLYQKRLDQLDTVATDSIQSIDDFRNLIDKHVTWIKSGSVFSWSDIPLAWDGLGAIIEPRRRLHTGQDLNEKMIRGPITTILYVAVLLIAVLVRLKAKSMVASIGRDRKESRDGWRWTLIAAGLTIVTASVVPAWLFWFASWLTNATYTSISLVCLAKCLKCGAAALWLIDLPRQCLRPLGLIDRHTPINVPQRAEAFRTLTWLAIVLVPASMLVCLFDSVDQGRYRESLGRLGFLTIMVGLIVLAHFAFRPPRGFVPTLLLAAGQRWAYRFRHLTYAIGVGIPTSLAALSLLGYGYTVGVLMRRLLITLVFIVAALAMIELCKWLMAWLWSRWADDGQIGVLEDESDEGQMQRRADYLRHRKYEQLRERLTFLGKGAMAVVVVMVLGSIWNDVIPTLKLANPTLWTVHEESPNYSLAESQQASTLATPVTMAGSTENDLSAAILGSSLVSRGSTIRPIPVTLFHVIEAAITLFFAYHLARTLPLILDVLFLDFLVRDEGLHHLLLVAGRTILACIGIVMAGRLLGIRWETIQWLVVALVVGLGFGMADMIRNLIGGFFVLLEKPATPGDLVTVGSMTGRVAFQRLRTTVLADEEGRELIVPNGKFMSEEVTNWTGAGKLCPITMDVEISRDVRLNDARAMLLGIASHHPRVLMDPEPQTTFLCLGKKTQQIELRVWLDKSNDSTLVQDDIRREIQKMLTRGVDSRMGGDVRTVSTKISPSAESRAIPNSKIGDASSIDSLQDMMLDEMPGEDLLERRRKRSA